MMITNEYKQWLNDGAIVTLEAHRRVSSVMRKDMQGRPSKRGKFRGSMIGDPCDRKRQLSYLGAEPNKTNLAFAIAGTWGHYRWQVAGLSVGFLAEIEVPLKGRNFSGHVDGVTPEGEMFEFKTTYSTRVREIRDTQKIPDDHFMQVQAYLHYGGWDSARVVYEDRAWLETAEVVVPREYEVGVGIERNIERLARRRYSLVDMHPECMAGSTMREQCGFRQECIERWGQQMAAERADRSMD